MRCADLAPRHRLEQSSSKVASRQMVACEISGSCPLLTQRLRLRQSQHWRKPAGARHEFGVRLLKYRCV